MYCAIWPGLREGEKYRIVNLPLLTCPPSALPEDRPPRRQAVQPATGGRRTRQDRRLRRQQPVRRERRAALQHGWHPRLHGPRDSDRQPPELQREGEWEDGGGSVCVCVCACACVCVRACARACVCARVRARACVRARARSLACCIGCLVASPTSIPLKCGFSCTPLQPTSRF